MQVEWWVWLLAAYLLVGMALEMDRVKDAGIDEDATLDPAAAVLWLPIILWWMVSDWQGFVSFVRWAWEEAEKETERRRRWRRDNR